MPRSAAPAVALAVALSAASLAASPRPVIDGEGACSGVAGRYLVTLRDGRATVLSAAEFPGGSPAGDGQGGDSSRGALWSATVSGFAPEADGCVAFDKDSFTWPGDLVTYVQYLVRELFVPARRMDPTLRTLAVRDRTVRLEVVRPGRDGAVLSGPEGAMLGYGRLEDAERFFLLPVLLDDGSATLVRVLRNRGATFGEHATEAIGRVLLRGDEWATTDAGPGFRIRRLPESRD